MLQNFWNGPYQVKTVDSFRVTKIGTVAIQFLKSKLGVRQGFDIKTIGSIFLKKGEAVSHLRTWNDPELEDEVHYYYESRNEVLQFWNVYERLWPLGETTEEMWTGNAGFYVEYVNAKTRVYHCSHGLCDCPDFESLMVQVIISNGIVASYRRLRQRYAETSKTSGYVHPTLWRKGPIMRTSAAILVVGLGLFALSMSAQSQVPPSQAVPKANFLSNISAGETIVIHPLSTPTEGFAIQVVTPEELRELVASKEEHRQYDEVQAIYHQQRSDPRKKLDEFSDEIKALLEKHKTLDHYLNSMRARIQRRSYTITQVGHDFLSYREGDDQVFLPAHRIKSITRPAR